MNGRENTQALLLSQEVAIAITSKVDFDCLKRTLAITRDLGMMILAFAIMCFSHLDRSAKFWIGMVTLAYLVRAVLFFASIMVGEPCRQGTCIINIEVVVTLLLIISAIGLIILSETILRDHLPQFPGWFGLVVIGYYFIFNVIFYVVVSSFLGYVGGIAQGGADTESNLQVDVETSAA